MLPWLAAAPAAFPGLTVIDETQYEYAGFWARVGAALIDTKKQGWHDKLAGTVVIRRRGGTAPVSFESSRNEPSAH